MSLRPNESEPCHTEELFTITSALAAARMHLRGHKPPDSRWELTEKLLDDAERATLQIQQCRRRTLFIR